MIVHLKQSGEVLTDRSDALHTYDALRLAAERIAEVHERANELDIEGLMVVSGGGNLTRGSELRDAFGPNSAVAASSDVVGRLATIHNTVMLAAALQDSGVPNKIFVAPGMGFCDATLGTLEPYSPEAVKETYARERVVLMAGGSGKDGQTTDAAVLDYTLAHAAAFPGDFAVAMKATKFNGIYNADPAVDADARRFERVAASWMLQHDLGGIDTRCAELIASADGDLALRVYSAYHSPHDAIREGLGTLVMSGAVEPVFAAETAL
jgi:uridylate kinase